MCAKLGVDPLADVGGSSRTSGMGGAGAAGGRTAKLWEAVGLGDWTYALAVQVVDICVSSRHLNGGLLEMQDLCEAVSRIRTGVNTRTQPASRSGKSEVLDAAEATTRVTVEDVLRALKTLQPLGCGYEVLTLGGRIYVRTLPQALDASTTILLSLLSAASTSDTAAISSSQGSSTPLPRDIQGVPYLTASVLQSPNLALNKEAWTAERVETALRNATQREGLLWVDEGVWPHRYYSLAINAASSSSSTQMNIAGALS